MGCRISSEVKNRRREEMSVEQIDEYIHLYGITMIPLLTAVPEPMLVPVPLPVPTPCNSNLTITVLSCQERSSDSPTKTEIRYRKSKESSTGLVHVRQILRTCTWALVVGRETTRTWFWSGVVYLGQSTDLLLHRAMSFCVTWPTHYLALFII